MRREAFRIAKTDIVLALLILAVPLVQVQDPLSSVAVWIDPDLLSLLIGVSPAESGEIPVVLQGISSFTGAQIERIGALGKLNTVIGDMATVRLPPTHVSQATRLKFVTRLEIGYAAPTLDISVPEIRADEAWQNAAGFAEARINGTGVVIGIVDTGIDPKHPDFRFENGSSKIRYLWDQTTSGVPPAGYSYGTEWTKEQIDAGVCSSKDQIGHGTHVAGIASGTGRSGGRYVGVAPGSSLIIVKSGVLTRKGWRFRWAEVIDGVNYIWQRAKTLGKRAVVNLSLGGNAGGHDGSSSVEKALDRFISEGLVVVVSAGNEGGRRTHAEGSLEEGESITLAVEPSNDEDEIYVEIWHSMLDDISVSVRTPNGQTIGASTSASGISIPNGTVHLAQDVAEIGKAWKLRVSSSSNLTSDKWLVSVRGRSISDGGRWDAWLSTKGQFLVGDGYEISRYKTITVPGTARSVITVGAYVTRVRWTAKNGTEQRYTTDENVGDIASFSSFGPTRDGRLKPEIAAPGKGIISARSTDSPASDSDPDAAYSIKQGTSMAAPHITGVVALIMQRNPSVSSSAVKEILRMTARQDSHTAEINMSGSCIWGFGKPNAEEAVTTSSVRYAVTLLLRGTPPSTTFEIVINGARRTVAPGEESLTFEASAGSTLSVSIGRTASSESRRVYVFYKKASKYVFARWVVESGGLEPVTFRNESMELVVDSQKTIAIEWHEQSEIEFDWYGAGAMLILVQLSVALAVFFVLRRRVRARGGLTVGIPCDENPSENCLSLLGLYPKETVLSVSSDVYLLSGGINDRRSKEEESRSNAEVSGHAGTRSRSAEKEGKIRLNGEEDERNRTSGS